VGSLAADARLADVVAERLRRFIGLEDGGQQAVLVQSLNPLAIAAIGFGSAFDLPREVSTQTQWLALPAAWACWTGCPPRSDDE
jgi:hypothetical protein